MQLNGAVGHLMNINIQKYAISTVYMSWNVFFCYIAFVVLKHLCSVMHPEMQESKGLLGKHIIFLLKRIWSIVFSIIVPQETVDHQIVIILPLKPRVGEWMNNSSEDIFLPLCQSLVVSLYICTRQRTSHQTRWVSLSDLWTAHQRLFTVQ